MSARPVSNAVSVPKVDEVPVEVVRREAPKALVFQSGQAVDGLRSSAMPGVEKLRDRSAVAHRTVPTSEPVAVVRAEQDMPAAPAAQPDRWTDPSRHSQPAMADRAQIAAPAVSLPAAVQHGPAETFAVARATFDVDIENISSEFDFLTLSEHTPAAAPAEGAADGKSATPAGSDAVTRRKLIRSDQPQLPGWYEEKGLSTVGTFRVHITPDGDVTSVDIEKTTGFKDIDARWISSIINWKYEKGESGGTRLVKVRIKLKK